MLSDLNQQFKDNAKWLKTVLIAAITLVIVLITTRGYADQTAQTQNFRSFTDWCVNVSSLPSSTRETVLALLKTVDTSDCKQASERLINLKTLTLRGPSARISLSGDPDYYYPGFQSKGQISDLTPLKTLPNLIELFLGNNQITDISPLQSLSKLTKIELSFNQITDISPLQSLTSLEFLWLKDNQISDLTPLQSLTNLSVLNLRNNKITDIRSLQSLINLERLDLSGPTHIAPRYQPGGSATGLLSDLSPLQTLVNLRRLELDNNQIRDISPLKPLILLGYLSLTNNLISDISPLEPLRNLTILWLGENRIADVTPLRSLTNLWYLNLLDNRISDASPLQSLNRLNELYLTDNPVANEVCPAQSKPSSPPPLPGLVCLNSVEASPLPLLIPPPKGKNSYGENWRSKNRSGLNCSGSGYKSWR